MIDTQILRAERVEPSRPPYLDVMYCARCKQGLGRVYLTVGSYVEMRCHHEIRGADGKRKTCGWMNSVTPTRDP